MRLHPVNIDLALGSVAMFFSPNFLTLSATNGPLRLASPLLIPKIFCLASRSVARAGSCALLRGSCHDITATAEKLRAQPRKWRKVFSPRRSRLARAPASLLPADGPSFARH